MLKRFFARFFVKPEKKKFENPNAYCNWMQEEYFACVNYRGGMKKYFSR